MYVWHEIDTRMFAECSGGGGMNRFRFYVPGDDGRPIAWPPVAPFWITGSSDTHTVVVAYAPSLEILTSANHWPDAEEIDDMGECEVSFSGRFPKPDWWPLPAPPEVTA